MVDEVVQVRPPEVAQFDHLTADIDGSWALGAQMADFSGGRIYGHLAGAGTSGPGLLREPRTLHGYPQRSVLRPELVAGRIAYVALPVGVNLASAWLDDDLIADAGDPIGASNLVWTSPSGLHLTASGALFITGPARRSNHQIVDVAVRYPGADIVLIEGSSTPDASGIIERILAFDTSRDGTHWIAAVQYLPLGAAALEEMLILDGSALLHPDGSTVRTGTLPPFPGPAGTGPWSAIRRPHVTDEGEVVYEAWTPSGAVLVRSDATVMELDPGTLVDVDSDGAALSVDDSLTGTQLRLDRLALTRAGLRGVDFDGDGVQDPAWSIVGPSGLDSASFSGPSGPLTLVNLSNSVGTGTQALVRARLAPAPDVVCGAVSHSFGRDARLRLIGTRRAEFNDLFLQVTDLPGAPPILPLCSRSTALVPMAGGSSGTLCLGGAIGRFPAIVPPADVNGTYALRLYTNALPQPASEVPALAGETWIFQVWYRDFFGTSAGSNFSDAVRWTFE